MRVTSSTGTRRGSRVAIGAVALLVIASACSGCMLPSVDASSADAGPDSTEQTDDSDGEASSPDTHASIDTAETLRDATPDGSSEDSGPCGTGAVSDPTTFQEVRTVIEDNGRCLDCHSGRQSGAQDSSLQFPSNGLTRCDYETALDDFVVACDAQNSPLYQSVLPGGWDGNKEMPIEGWTSGYGQNEDTLRDWINQGAEIPGCE